MPTDVQGLIKQRIGQFVGELEAKVSAWLAVRDAVAFRAMELEMAAHGREVGDDVVAIILQAIVRDVKFQVEASLAARAPRSGWRSPARARHGPRSRRAEPDSSDEA